MRVQVRMCARDQIQASARVYSRVDLRERAHIWAYALHIYARLFSAVLRGFLLLGGVLVFLAVMDSLGVLLGWLVCLLWWGAGLWFSCGVVCGRDLFPPSYVRGAGGGCAVHLWGRVCATCVHIRMCVHIGVLVRALVLVHKRPNLCTCSPVRMPPRSCGCVRVRARWRPYNILSPPETFLSNFYGSGVMTRVVSTDVQNRYPYNKTPPDKRRVFLVAVIREACEKF